MSLQDLIIGRFISRTDCLAIQSQNDGSWMPYREFVNNEPGRLIPWSRDILQQHLDGNLTAGHYMLNSSNDVKIIAFDIDFTKDGPLPTSYDSDGVPGDFVRANLREEWHNRASAHRNWLKTELRVVSHKIAAMMWKHLELPVACAYSGNKGVHVYGFTGDIQAEDARLGAELVLNALGDFKLTRGSFEWGYVGEDEQQQGISIEVFPKQDQVSADGFGNLMALPLGVNRKHPDDPKFFLDMRAPLNALIPADPEWALSTTNPWEG